MFPLKDSIKSSRIPFVTWTIILVNVLVFFWQLSSPDLNTLVYQYALVPDFIDFSNPTTWYPFITSIFMHGGFIHILSNMWFLAVFGDNVEDRMGHMGYFLFYIAAGIIASLLQMVFTVDGMIPMLGASGAIAGVLGAYFVLYPFATVKTFVVFYYRIGVVNYSAKVLLGFWALTQFLNSVGSIGVPGGGVAWFAHLGGFLIGVGIGYLLKVFVNRPVYEDLDW